MLDKMLFGEEKPSGRHWTIYVPSKGRPKPKTAIFLKQNGITNFKIVVEPQDYQKYRNNFNASYLLQLPKNDQGIWYARDFIKTHARLNNEKYHWQFDDDLNFYKRNDKIKKNIPIVPDKKYPNEFYEMLWDMEKFTDIGHCQDLHIIAFTHRGFAFAQTEKLKWNHHVASAFLLYSESEAEFRPNTIEDLDLCMQILTKGYNTLTFTKYIYGNPPNNTQPGGLTGEYYDTITKRQRKFIKDWKKYNFTLYKPKKGKVKIHNIDSTIRGYGIWSKFRQDMKLKKIVIN